MNKLFAAMAKAFPEIEGATKDSNNPHFKSKYADLSSVVDAIKPALCKHALFYAQMTHEQEGGVCVETIVGHESGEQFSFGKLFVPASKQDAQGYGSALTYARRYSLMTAFGVCPEDDDGNAAVRAPVNDRQGNDTAEEPAQREKLEGPFASKSALQGGMRAFVNKLLAAQSVSEIEALESRHAAELAQCERYLPVWWNGDGADKRGVKGQIADAKEALTQADEGMFGALIRSMKENETLKSFTAWNATNEALIDGLNDIDRRRFEKERDAFESGLTALGRRNAG